jgi:hypothetical protein
MGLEQLNRFDNKPPAQNMRKLILRVVVPVVCLLASETMAHPLVTDSVKANHATDGNINEWKPEKFETDKETLIAYSVDHDAANLYLAVKVTDPAMQMKMMMQGMSLYLDKNGKKKEKTGIHFPVKRERESGGGGQRGGGAPPDPKEMREKMASTMILLKTFGFENQDEEKTQLIADPNGINIAFNWDDANNFYIEYQVPFSLLAAPADLKDKTLGIGWKVHGMESTSGSTGAPTQMVVVPVGGRSSGSGAPSSRGGGSRSSAPSMGPSSDPRFKEQSMWAKYVLTF